jgi:ribosome-binding protein aMBF1 (putative translation factor)
VNDISADLYFELHNGETHVTTDEQLRQALLPRERYGAKVRWLRQGARLTGRELCRRVGITPSYLSDIETGRRLPAPSVSDRIADALGIDHDALWRLALLERLSERDLRVLGFPTDWMNAALGTPR